MSYSLHALESVFPDVQLFFIIITLNIYSFLELLLQLVPVKLGF